MKCAIAGCNKQPTVLAIGQKAPQGVAIRDQYLYWSNAGTFANGAYPNCDGTIQRIAK
jgi:hypothetical protein